MSSNKKRRCTRVPADEQGIDPSAFFEPRNEARAERKVQQLCREVQRTLSYAFGSVKDDKLRDLIVMSVEAAPDASRLLVTLCPSAGRLDVDVRVLMDRIEAVRGVLRREVAEAIQRKRTPELAFRIVSSNEPEVGQ